MKSSIYPPLFRVLLSAPALADRTFSLTVTHLASSKTHKKLVGSDRSFSVAGSANSRPFTCFTRCHDDYLLYSLLPKIPSFEQKRGIAWTAPKKHQNMNRYTTKPLFCFPALKCSSYCLCNYPVYFSHGGIKRVIYYSVS